LLNPVKILQKDRFTAKYSPSVSWTAAIFNYERWTRGARTQLEFTSRDYEFTSSRNEWNAVSLLVNSSSQVHESNGTQHIYSKNINFYQVKADTHYRTYGPYVRVVRIGL